VLLLYLYPRGEERYLSASRLTVERALEAAAERTLPGGRALTLPGRSGRMRLACAVLGVLGVLLPHVLASPWMALHGHFNYLDALSEAHENPFAAVVWADEWLRLAVGVFSLLLAFRYVPTHELVQVYLPHKLRLPLRSLGDVLPFKTWVLPLLVCVYATPTAAIALSLWTHLSHFYVRIMPPEPEPPEESPEQEKAEAAAPSAAAPAATPPASLAAPKKRKTYVTGAADKRKSKADKTDKRKSEMAAANAPAPHQPAVDEMGVRLAAASATALEVSPSTLEEICAAEDALKGDEDDGSASQVAAKKPPPMLAATRGRQMSTML